MNNSRMPIPSGAAKIAVLAIVLSVAGCAPPAEPDDTPNVEVVDIVKQPPAFDYPGQNVSAAVYDRMIYEKDAEIETRDGTIIRANVFRPDVNAEAFPTLIAMTTYVKDVRAGEAELEEIEQAGNYHTHELPNPDFWVARGYAVVWVDTRGTGTSSGKADVFSDQEARDYFDAIEWTAAQSWSDGKVASTGISYMAMIQWNMARQQPPHLAAMIPWEGADHGYRFTHHGGIPSDVFFGGWFNRVESRQPEHPEGLTGTDRFARWMPVALTTDLDDEVFENYSGDHADITAPLLSVGNWGGSGLHHPGNIDGYVEASSEHKILAMNTGSHIGPYYSVEGTLLQLRFVDHFLKGMDTGIQNEPPVRLTILSAWDDYEVRLENEWPLARTAWTRYYLNPAASGAIEGGQHNGTLTLGLPSAAEAITYSAEPLGKTYGVSGPRARAVIDRDVWPYNWSDAATFVTEAMAEDTEITGPIKLVMWVSSSVDDMEIFATVRNLDTNGDEVMIHGGWGPDVSVSKGWLRASMRKLDPACATAEYQPCHTFDEKQMLTPGEIVPVEVRIDPIGMVFKKGHRLMLDIQSGDSPGSRANFTHKNEPFRKGENTIYTGGDMASYLLLPIIPPHGD